MSVLNKSISYFPSKTASTQGVEVDLLTLLQSDKHKERIIGLRASESEAQMKLKYALPCYTVAGTFSRRTDEGLIHLSGLAAVDLDSAEDYDVLYLLNELRKIDCIAYAGLSCRGKRLFCIIPFLHPDKYTKHYERLVKSFSDLGLPMGDDCHKTISQPRFVSWNDNSTQFFNHDARPYHLLQAEKTNFIVKRNYQSAGISGAPENPFQWCIEQVNKSYSFSKGSRHAYIMHLIRYCNIKGLQESVTLQGCLGFVETDFPETEIRNLVRHIYTTQSSSHAIRPFKAKELQHHEKPVKQLAQFEKQSKEIASVPDLEPLEESNPVRSARAKQKYELEEFFKTAVLPCAPVALKPGETIINVPVFVDTSLQTIRANRGNRTFQATHERLQDLKTILSPVNNRN